MCVGMESDVARADFGDVYKTSLSRPEGERCVWGRKHVLPGQAIGMFIRLPSPGLREVDKCGDGSMCRPGRFLDVYRTALSRPEGR